MSHSALAKTIDEAFEKRESIGPKTRGPVRKAVEQALDLLDSGKARVAEKQAGGNWLVHQWLKKAVLLSFRLNDMIGGHVSVVPQMRFRADVVRAACPELLVDTDDWRVPSLAAWREYLEVKPELGVPSLYYATHLDATGEALGQEDYHLLRQVWNRYQAMRP